MSFLYKRLIIIIIAIGICTQANAGVWGTCVSFMKSLVSKITGCYGRPRKIVDLNVVSEEASLNSKEYVMSPKQYENDLEYDVSTKETPSQCYRISTSLANPYRIQRMMAKIKEDSEIKIRTMGLSNDIIKNYYQLQQLQNKELSIEDRVRIILYSLYAKKSEIKGSPVYDLTQRLCIEQLNELNKEYDTLPECLKSPIEKFQDICSGKANTKEDSIAMYDDMQKSGTTYLISLKNNNK